MAKSKRSAGPRMELLVSFRDSEDPSPEQLEALHGVIARLKSATILAEIAGSLKIEIDPGEAEDLRAQLPPEWVLSHEGVAQMPPTRGLKGSS